MRKQQNARGFSILEILLLLVIAGMIGFIGWFVWQSKAKADKSLSAASKTSAADSSAVQKQAISDSIVGWKAYTDTKRNFSFQYPKDWSVNAQPQALYDPKTNKSVDGNNLTIILTSPGATSQGAFSGISVQGGAGVLMVFTYDPRTSSLNPRYLKDPVKLTIDNKVAYISSSDTYTYNLLDKPYAISADLYIDPTLAGSMMAYKDTYDSIVKSLVY